MHPVSILHFNFNASNVKHFELHFMCERCYTNKDYYYYYYIVINLLSFAYVRYILVDWLVEVTTMKALSSLTLQVTVGCVDRYLALRSVPKARLQLLGIACMVVCTR